MAIEIFQMKQNSDEWLQARLGIPTSSCFDTVMAKGKAGGESVTRRKYMLTLIGERMTGVPSEGFSNSHMDRGHSMEPEARELYSMVSDNEPAKVGFIRNGNAGASPDSLVGDNGLLEIKTKLPHLQLECLLADKIPADHVKQIQGQLWIAEREWCDLVVYWPGLPLFTKRAHRDEALIKSIATAVDEFNTELLELVERIQQKRAA